MAKKYKRVSFKQRLETAYANGESNGYMRGTRDAEVEAEKKYNTNAREKERLELAQRILSMYGQTFVAMVDGVNAALGVK